MLFDMLSALCMSLFRTFSTIVYVIGMVMTSSLVVAVVYAKYRWGVSLLKVLFGLFFDQMILLEHHLFQSSWTLAAVEYCFDWIKSVNLPAPRSLYTTTESKRAIASCGALTKQSSSTDRPRKEPQIGATHVRSTSTQGKFIWSVFGLSTLSDRIGTSPTIAGHLMSLSLQVEQDRAKGSKFLGTIGEGFSIAINARNDNNNPREAVAANNNEEEESKEADANAASVKESQFIKVRFRLFVHEDDADKLQLCVISATMTYPNQKSPPVTIYESQVFTRNELSAKNGGTGVVKAIKVAVPRHHEIDAVQIEIQVKAVEQSQGEEVLDTFIRLPEPDAVLGATLRKAYDAEELSKFADVKMISGDHDESIWGIEYVIAAHSSVLCSLLQDVQATPTSSSLATTRAYKVLPLDHVYTPAVIRLVVLWMHTGVLSCTSSLELMTAVYTCAHAYDIKELMEEIVAELIKQSEFSSLVKIAEHQPSTPCAQLYLSYKALIDAQFEVKDESVVGETKKAV